MIPISDDNPVRLTPVVNWAIIALCVAAFLWELSLGRDMDAVIGVLGFTPATLSASQTAQQGYLIVPGWATIFISMFLHGGFLHIAGNMLYLWIFGNNVEDAMGHVRFTVFYLVCGVAAALAMAAMNPRLAGADGGGLGRHFRRAGGLCAALSAGAGHGGGAAGHHLLSAEDQRDLGGGLLVRDAAPERGAVPSPASPASPGGPMSAASSPAPP